jgi:acyl-coenzyme A thioesterase PaaI-like protein
VNDVDLCSSGLGGPENVEARTYSAEPSLPSPVARAAKARGLFGPQQANEFLTGLLSPWTRELGLTVEACAPAGAVLRLPRNPRILRPGNALSGQALLACADAAMAVAIMGHLGEPRTVAAVTIAADFMRAISDADVMVAATVRRRARALIFTECTFIEPGTPEIAVHATATWAFVPTSI